MVIEIKRTKLKSGDLLEVDFSKSIVRDGEIIEVSEDSSKGRFAASDSLMEAFKPLTLHFALLTEYMDENKIDDPEEYFSDFDKKLNDHGILKQMCCNQFIISGSGEKEGVTLCGHRLTKHGMKINMNSPFIKWDDEGSVYNFTFELREHIDALKSEVVKYLHGHGKNIQLSLFPSEKEILVESA